MLRFQNVTNYFFNILNMLLGCSMPIQIYPHSKYSRSNIGVKPLFLLASSRRIGSFFWLILSSTHPFFLLSLHPGAGVDLCVFKIWQVLLHFFMYAQVALHHVFYFFNLQRRKYNYHINGIIIYTRNNRSSYVNFSLYNEM
jgi:hypothetical protein